MFHDALRHVKRRPFWARPPQGRTLRMRSPSCKVPSLAAKPVSVMCLMKIWLPSFNPYSNRQEHATHKSNQCERVLRTKIKKVHSKLFQRWRSNIDFFNHPLRVIFSQGLMHILSYCFVDFRRVTFPNPYFDFMPLFVYR